MRVLLLFLFPLVAHAQVPNLVLLNTGAPMLNLTLANTVMAPSMRQLQGQSNKSRGDPVAGLSRGIHAKIASTSFASDSASATGPQKMAAFYPENSRTDALRVFQGLLGSYSTVEQQFNIPHNDVAGAVAMFLSGSYEAYHDTSIEPAQFKALVAQMRQVIGSNADFAKASNAEKQEMYEQMAILGMFMAATQDELSRKPNPQIAANMKQAAKGYLEQFLKTDADKVEITAQGLVIR